MHTFQSLTDDLVRAGFQRTDTVLVHSSMKSIGKVEGGADTVLDVLSDYFGKEGLLVFPTGSWSSVDAEHPVFNVNTTETCIGLLPRMFRVRPGVIRSLHPTHSVAALGKDAAAFTAGHECFDTPCDRKSPWGRLADRHGKIMMIGCSIKSNTFLHGVEQWNVPREIVFAPQQQLLYSEDATGRRVAVPSWRHKDAHSAYYDRPEAMYRQSGILRDRRFGDAVCHIFDCEKLAALVSEILAFNPLYFTPPEQ